MENGSILKEKHHVRQELCTNRPQYRQGRKLTAVKVYSISDESQYLLIHGVPQIAVTTELETLCLGYGSIDFLKLVHNYPAEKFCEVYVVKFHTIQSARFAKRKMDDRSFYGGTLHVCYAPELETLDDTRKKLLSRKQDISNKLKPSNRQHSLKRKEPFLSSQEEISGTQITSTSVSTINSRPSLEGLSSSSIVPDSTGTAESELIENLQLTNKPDVPQPPGPPVKRIVYHVCSKPTKLK